MQRSLRFEGIRVSAEGGLHGLLPLLGQRWFLFTGKSEDGTVELRMSGAQLHGARSTERKPSDAPVSTLRTHVERRTDPAGHVDGQVSVCLGDAAVHAERVSGWRPVGIHHHYYGCHPIVPGGE